MRPVPGNGNSHVFCIQGLEGPTEDDELSPDPSGSLLEHIHSLGGLDRISYEELWPAPSGSLFLREDQPPEDPTPSPDSEDVLDHPELLCSLDEAEKGIRPDHSRPQYRFRYMGDFRQPFHDFIPEDHPDQALLHNLAWATVYGPAPLQRALHYCRLTDRDLAADLYRTSRAEGDLYDGFTQALTAAEDRLRARILQASLPNDPAYQWLCSLLKLVRSRPPSLEIYKCVAVLGKALYRGAHPFINGGKPFKLQGYHWATYQRLRKATAPPVLVGTLDLNRCYLGELARLPGIGGPKARDIVLNRPYGSLGEAVQKGRVSWRELAVASMQEACTIVDRMIEGGSSRMATSRALVSLEKERGGRQGIEAVWEFYRISCTRRNRTSENARS